MWIRKNPHICNYYVSLVKAISSFSFKLNSTGNLVPMGTHPDDPNFVEFSNRAIQPLLSEKFQVEFNLKDVDTVIVPTIGMGSLGIFQDENVVSEFFNLGDENSVYYVSSPYLNLTENYTEILLKIRGKLNIITASPEANSFFPAKDISGYIPVAYSSVEEAFFKKVQLENRSRDIHMWEYNRHAWTFHAKGIWHVPSSNTSDPSKEPMSSHLNEMSNGMSNEMSNAMSNGMPDAIVIGSGNLGNRSKHRDLEAQMVLLTSNPNLRKRMKAELDGIMKEKISVDEKTFETDYRKSNFFARRIFRLLADFL
eukprot:TRINITY_DN1645_c2_g1_i3.p1 TRINITY_DN1645_c2_g1~~TRINITY_DN1645_c2_g1_i3.p1  ORF type:complete len:310 (-),score=129.70 TRINITY_DN1645_c2_g1_i3:42-971(-)